MISYLLSELRVISLLRRNLLLRLLLEELIELEIVAVTKNWKSLVELPRFPIVKGFPLTDSYDSFSI